MMLFDQDNGGGGNAASPSTSAPAPAPSPAPSSAPSNDLNIPTEVEQIFNFDPFAPGSEGLPQTTEPSPATPPTPAPVQAVPPAPAAPSATPTPTPVAPAPGQGQLTPEEADLLRQQVQTLQADLAAARGGPPPTQPQTATGDGRPEPDIQVPPYQLELPDGLKRLLISENADERLMGTAHLVQGASQIVHRQVVRAMRQELGQVLPQLIQHFAERVVTEHAAKRAIFEDFYGAHKDLNRPELRELIKSIGKQVSQEFGNPGWSPQLRDAIAGRVKATIAGVVPPPPVAQPNGAPPPSTPPAMTSPTSRPAPSNMPSQQQEMLDMLHF